MFLYRVGAQGVLVRSPRDLPWKNVLCPESGSLGQVPVPQHLRRRTGHTPPPTFWGGRQVDQDVYHRVGRTPARLSSSLLGRLTPGRESNPTLDPVLPSR